MGTFCDAGEKGKLEFYRPHELKLHPTHKLEVPRSPQHCEVENPMYCQVRLSENKSRPAQTAHMSETPWLEVLPEVFRTPQHCEMENPMYRQVRLSGNKSSPAQTVRMSETPCSEVLPEAPRTPQHCEAENPMCRQARLSGNKPTPAQTAHMSRTPLSEVFPLNEAPRAPQHCEVENPMYRQVRLSGTKSRPAQTVYMSETPWSDVLPVRKRNTGSETERLGHPRRARQRDTRSNLPRYLCTFFVGIEDDAEFTVAKRIIGPRGRNMKYIAEESQGSKIRLRGRGSMFTERETGYESAEPLQINVSVVSRSPHFCNAAQRGYKRAKDLVATLLTNIYDEYSKVYGIKVNLDLFEDPHNPA